MGGPNGAGKTTLAIEYAQEIGFPYVGADAIAATLNPADPASVRTAAAREFIETIGRLTTREESFVCETTLSGLTMRNFIAAASVAGFSVSIAFLFVETADACVARVAERVRKGGHDVPEADIRRRFTRSLGNFWTIYRELADNWVLLYNGVTALQDVAAGSREQTAIRDPGLLSTYLDIVGASP